MGYFLLTKFILLLMLKTYRTIKMKKSVISFVFLFFSITFTAYAAEEEGISDPLSVLSNISTPKQCIKEDIDNHSLSLSDLIEIALCNNPTLNRSYMEAKASAASYGESLSTYFPSITGEADTGYNSSKIGGGSSQSSSDAGASISLSWLIYDFGGRQADVAITKKNLEAANFSHNQLMQDTIFSVINAYYNLLSARELLNSVMVNEEAFRKSYEVASKRYDLGLVRLSDKLQAETSYAQNGKALFPSDCFGVAFSVTNMGATGDPLADIAEDLAAEQKARATYEHLIDLTTDPDVIQPLLFLRQREVVHYQRFKELYEYYAKMLNKKI